MRKMLLLLSLGMLCASLAMAQDTPNSSPTAAPSATTNSVQGCLSGTDGNFMLVQDNTGMTYKLVGGDSQLKKHVGHEVAVTGQVSNGASGSGASTMDQGQSSADQGQAQPSTAMSDSASIQVTDVKMISKKCSSEGSSPQQPR